MRWLAPRCAPWAACPKALVTQDAAPQESGPGLIDLATFATIGSRVTLRGRRGRLQPPLATDMFSKGDPANKLKRFRVTLKMREGESEACTILAPAHHPLRQSLNDDGPFVEIETEDGGQAFVLKAEIARIDLHEAAEPRPADSDSTDYSRFEASDARLVLGVSVDAAKEELHGSARGARPTRRDTASRRPGAGTHQRRISAPEERGGRLRRAPPAGNPALDGEFLRRNFTVSPKRLQISSSQAPSCCGCLDIAAPRRVDR
jgi:hypothetical protein